MVFDDILGRKKTDVSKLNSAEVRMLSQRWARWKTRSTSEMKTPGRRQSVETFLENKILKSFGHCLRREHNNIMCEIAKPRSFWEKKQRWTEKEM